MRGARMLRTALGSRVAAWLEDPAIVEVMLNPDGRLWVDRLKEGLADTGEFLPPADGLRIVQLVADHVGGEVHRTSPRISAELPESGERFEGAIPHVVAAPTFAIRKPAAAVFTLDDYVASGIMKPSQATTLRDAVVRRLQCRAPNLVSLRTAALGGACSMRRPSASAERTFRPSKPRD
jgi:type IV secretion system protein TrbB